MLHVRVCTLQRENPSEPFGFDLWRSRRKSSSTNQGESENSDVMIIKAVAPGGPAAKGKLCGGDKIIAVNGTNVRNSNEVKQLLDNALEVRVMVERWEGPKVDNSERKASDPTAPERAAQGGHTGRRRSNTLRDMPISDTDVQRWPRNYGLAQNYPSSSSPGGSAGGIQVSPIGESFLHSPSNSRSPNGRRSGIPGSSDDRSDNTCTEEDEDRPTRSILDTCPEGRFLLSMAGRGFYSEDLRGD